MARKKKCVQETMNMLCEDLAPPKRQRPNLTPLQWEQMAKWIEARALQAELRAVQARDLYRRKVVGDAILPQIGYWEATVAVSRKLAYDCRIGNNGPLNLKTPDVDLS